MKISLSFIARSVLLFVLVIAMLLLVNKILLPKTYYTHDWPSTSTFAGFYQMDKNSVDVLFFGSSHGVSSFIPQEIYDQYGICSYNLSSEQQNPFVSYYWLKEACKYQTPKAVVLESFIFFPYNGAEALNSSESCTRYAFDAMRYSDIKAEAIADIELYDKNQDARTYYWTNKRFHTRIKGNLGENDFLFSEIESHNDMKGYSCLNQHCGLEFVPFAADDSVEAVPMVPLMEEYVIKIVEYCRENHIDLIIVSTPSQGQTQGHNKSLRSFCKEHDVEYVDFNMNTIYASIAYNFANDNYDGGHLAYWGAIKVSDYLGTFLQKRGVPAKSDPQWEESRVFYNHMIQKAKLKDIVDINEYLEAIKDQGFAVFISAKDDASCGLSEQTVERLRQLGLAPSITGHDSFRASYYAVLIPGKQPIEYSSMSAIQTQGQFRNGKSYYSLLSAGLECGNASSIIIDGYEYSTNYRGLNIVVYDPISRQVFDSVCFDTCDAANPAIR